MSNFNRRALLGGIAAGAAALAAPAIAQSRVVVRAGYIPVLGGAPLFVIDKDGWARDAGIDLRLVQFDSGPNMIQAVASGTLETYWAGVAPLAVARAKGLDIRVVAATATEELAFVAGGRLREDIDAANGDVAAGFKRFFDATKKAARVATQPAGSVPNVTLQHWLWEVAKIDRAHVEIVPMGIDATQQALLAKAVDGATVREPALTIILDRDKGAKLIASGGQMLTDQPGGVFAVTGAFVKSNEAAVQKLVDLTVRATDLLINQPERAVPAILAVLGRGIVDDATVLRALRSPGSKFTADPNKIVKSTQALLEYQVKVGANDRVPPLDGLFDDSYFRKAARVAG